MFGLSLFRPSRQSNISTSGEERFKYPLPWENKISQMPYPSTNKTIKSSPHALPPHPTGMTLIDRCITTIIFFFLQYLPAFTCYFHCSIISYHFIHSLPMTHFTSNYYYTLKIACVCCIFACSHSLSHPFSFTIITHVGGSNG